jgi:alpha-tubulin suppressor-like RCC1 family protein
MSIAVTEENQVYNWGFLGDGEKQFSLIEDFGKMKEDIVDVKLGNTFMLFLTSSGKVYFKGSIS